MASSGMLPRVALVRTDVSEELSASNIRVTRIGALGTPLAVTSNRRTLRRNTLEGCHVTGTYNYHRSVIGFRNCQKSLSCYFVVLCYSGTFPFCLLQVSSTVLRLRSSDASRRAYGR
jgi:hypothetical protein